MRIKKNIPIFLTLILISFFVCLKSSQGFDHFKGKKNFSIILITLDTIRADRIGCYGFSDIKTPIIDSFAHEGVMFKKCFAPTPLTLPSHTSIMSGTLPLYHGVRDNTGFLVPSELPTLAKVFKNSGYETAAFVAAYVLDSKWGLDKGFDYYFDQFDLGLYKSQSIADIQRPADKVMDKVLTWVSSRNLSKFFIWIHLFDPHTPYEPPSPYKEEYPNNPYLGEIAFADNQLGRLVEYIKESHLVENTIIVFTGDHGESLGEHEEQTHGFFIYQEGIHVPLIFVTPFKKFQGITRDMVVSSIDIAPTILEMAGLPIPMEVQGQSLLPLFYKEKSKKNVLAYSETYYPRFHFGWSELKSIQDERYKVIVSPKAELYDLYNDPHEINNLAEKDESLLRYYFDKYNQFVSEFSRNAHINNYTRADEKSLQILKSLGYIGTPINTSSLKKVGKELANPRDKIDLFNRIGMAYEIGSQGKFNEAVSILEKVITEEPEVMNAYTMLGNLYFSQGQYDKAVTYFNNALEKRPDDPTSIISIANSYIKMKKFSEAENVLINYLENVQPDSVDSMIFFLLGKINWALNNYDDSLKYYYECLKLNPNSSTTLMELAKIYSIQEQTNKAEQYIQRCLNLNPKLTDAHYTLAQILEKKGAKQAAIHAYLKEMEISPNHFSACYNLSVLYRELGRVPEEKRYLEKAIEINPNFPLSYIYLARIYLKLQENYEEAIKLVNEALKLKLNRKYEAASYFLLADLYNRLGDQSLSLEFARRGQEVSARK